MKKDILFPLLLMILMHLFTSQMTMAQMSIEAQLRPRFELRNGYKQLVPKEAVPTAIISQRTRFSFLYQTQQLKVKIVPQDVRIWGDEQLANTSGVFGDHASLDLHEAYAEIRLKPSLFMTIGRQELIYDNMSILSNRNWNQTGLLPML